MQLCCQAPTTSRCRVSISAPLLHCMLCPFHGPANPKFPYSMVLVQQTSLFLQWAQLECTRRRQFAERFSLISLGQRTWNRIPLVGETAGQTLQRPTLAVTSTVFKMHVTQSIAQGWVRFAI